jgi:transcriptional regulator with XRE-family HTH domain
MENGGRKATRALLAGLPFSRHPITDNPKGSPMTKQSTTSLAQKTAFANWLRDQLALRRWRPSDLAAHSGVSLPTISQLLHGKHAPEPSTCKKLAQALSLPAALVCERAGFLPARPGAPSAAKQALISLVENLPETEALRFLIRTQARLSTQAERPWWA